MQEINDFMMPLVLFLGVLAVFFIIRWSMCQKVGKYKFRKRLKTFNTYYGITLLTILLINTIALGLQGIDSLPWLNFLSVIFSAILWYGALSVLNKNFKEHVFYGKKYVFVVAQENTDKTFGGYLIVNGTWLEAKAVLLQDTALKGISLDEEERVTAVICASGLNNPIVKVRI